MRSKTISLLLVTVALVLTLGLASQSARAAQLYGVLSNFDLHQFVDLPNVNNMELILYGDGLKCQHIRNYYPGWGTVLDCGEYVPAGGCEDLGGGYIKITWKDPANPIPFCEYRHMGVRFWPDAPDVRAVAAYWTADDVIVGIISFIIQTWEGYAACPVGDIIWVMDEIPVPPDPGPPWIIERYWAWSPTVVPLDSMTVDNPMVTGLTWVGPFVDTLPGIPGESSEIITDPMPQEGGVLVRYDVVADGNVEAVFINQAVLEPPGNIPTLSEWAMIVFAVVILALMTYVVIRRRKNIQPTTA
jgi:hypothetical protein